MNKFTKKIVIMVVALMLIVSTVSAAKLNITWDWEASVPGITAFRYQLDGENVDNWTVVKSDVTSFTAEDLDSNVDHNFYLQQSFDGQSWSDSAVDTIAAIADEEILVEAKVKVNEEVKVAKKPIKSERETTKTNIVVKETASTSVEETTPTVVKENNKVKKEVIINKAQAHNTKYNDYYTMLSFGSGSYLGSWENKEIPKSFGDMDDYGFLKVARFNPYLSFEIEFANVASFGKFSGFGFRLGLDYSLMLRDYTNWKKEYTTHKMMFWQYDAFQVLDPSFAFAYNINFSNVVGLDLFAGGFASFSLPNGHNSSELRTKRFQAGEAAFSFGWLAGLELKLFAGNVVVFSVTPTYRYEWGNAHQVMLEGSLGFRF